MYTPQLQGTPLHKASSECHTTIVQLLLKAKADVNARDVVSTKNDIECCRNEGNINIHQMANPFTFKRKFCPMFILLCKT